MSCGCNGRIGEVRGSGEESGKGGGSMGAWVRGGCGRDRGDDVEVSWPGGREEVRSGCCCRVGKIAWKEKRRGERAVGAAGSGIGEGWGFAEECGVDEEYGSGRESAKGRGAAGSGGEAWGRGGVTAMGRKSSMGGGSSGRMGLGESGGVGVP